MVRDNRQHQRPAGAPGVAGGAQHNARSQTRNLSVPQPTRGRRLRTQGGRALFSAVAFTCQGLKSRAESPHPYPRIARKAGRAGVACGARIVDWLCKTGGDGIEYVGPGWRTAPARRLDDAVPRPQPTAVLTARQSSRLRGSLPGGIVRVIPGWAGRGVATRTDWKPPFGSIHLKDA